MNVVFLTGQTGKSTFTTYTTWIDPNTGVAYVQYWPANQTPSSGAVNTTGAAYVGTGASLASTSVAYPTTAYHPGRTVEEAGIRAGEIIGYRAWRCEEGDVLGSLFMGTKWLPGRSEQTEVPLRVHGGTGFYAFKTMEGVKDEFPGSLYDRLVYGEVALWGEVYEHERGYRAQYAKITRLIEFSKGRKLGRLKFWRPSTLTRLRRKYGVPG